MQKKMFVKIKQIFIETKLENEEKIFWFLFLIKNKIMQTTYEVERVFKGGPIKRFQTLSNKINKLYLLLNKLK